MERSEIPTYRPYIGFSDISGMLDVHARCREIDSVDPYSVTYRVPNLLPDQYAKDVALSLVDGTDKNILIADVQGEMVAHCRLEWWREWDKERNAEKTAYLIRAWVVPEWRRKGIGTYLLNWGESRAREMDQDSAIPGELAANTTDGENDATQLLLKAGYSIRFLSPELSYDDFSELPIVSTPDGFEIRPMEVDDHVPIARALIISNAPNTMTPEQLDRWIAGELPGFVEFTSSCDPVISRIATKDGEVVGLYLCRRKDDVGDVANVAVVPQFRMLGLSRAMMFQCLDAMKADGITRARVFTGIGADRDATPEGPYKMYLRFGFRLMTFHNRYRKPIT